MARDYYEVLGVSRQANTAEIKKAYRRIAMQHHPDRNPDDSAAEKKFKEAQKAYEVLSDSRKRATYDQFGHQGARGTGQGSHSQASGFGDFESIFGDFFGGDIFGGGRRGAGASAHHRGADLEYEISLTLEEAAKGKEHHIQIGVPVACKVCKGTGAKPGSGYKNCHTCEGSGTLRSQQGFFSVQQTCPTCRGAGQIIAEVCTECGGSRQTHKAKKLAAKIPAGVDTGDRIRLAGEGGGSLNGGPPGDLYIHINVKPHPIFKRNGHHLFIDVPISFTAATLGGEVKIPTLAGKINLKIPGGTQTGKQFRMRGKGIQTARGHGIGDMICTVHIETPVHLTAEQKKLLNEFDASLHSGNTKKHSPKTQSWVRSVRDFFTDLDVL